MGEEVVAQLLHVVSSYFVSLLHDVSRWNFSGNGFLHHPPPHTDVSSWTIGGEVGVRKVWFSTDKGVANHFLKERNSARCVHPSIKIQPSLFQTSQRYSSLWLYFDGSFFWNLLCTSSFQTCTRRTSRPVREEIMCYDSNLILSSDKNCCIVSLTNYEKERSKTIVTWKQSSDWNVWSKNLTTDASVAVLFVLARTEQMGNQSYGKVGLD